jgi:hypothetical protein
MHNSEGTASVKSYKLLVSCAAGSFAVLALFGSADAVTVTNRDDKEHKITIIEGDVKNDMQLKAAGVLENICSKGCVVRLNDSESDEYELEGAEIVSIEDGYLYYDGPEVPEAAPGTPPKQQ